MIIVVVFIVAMLASAGIGACITYLILTKKHIEELAETEALSNDAGWHEGFSSGWDACKADFPTIAKSYNAFVTRENPIVE